MRRLIGSTFLVVAAVAAGCAADRAPSLPDNADGAPRPPGSTSTTAASASPECQTFARYSLAQAAIAFAADGAPGDLASGFTAASAEMQTLLPEYLPQLQQVEALSLKDIQGTLTYQEAQDLQAAFAPLTAWNAEHCGGSPDQGT